MSKRLTIIAFLLLGGTAAAATVYAASQSFFLGAPAGVPVAFEYIQLPNPVLTPGERAHPAASNYSPFNPTLDEIFYGGTVITTEAQMKHVWNRIFDVPFDASLFNFNDTFVVLMGGGATEIAVFGISAVERVDATYPQFGFGWGGGVDVDPFLCVTSTTYFPGAYPQDPPPLHYIISAVKISKDLFDDVVFHRDFVYGV
ncbi:MAG: hypothetical protein ACKVS6_14195 [Planctomycetota bacterium]